MCYRYSIDKASILYRYCKDTVSIQCRYSIHTVSILYRYIMYKVSMQYRYSIDTVSIQYRYWIDTVSILYRYCIDTVSILYRYSTDNLSIQHRCCNGLRVSSIFIGSRCWVAMTRNPRKETSKTLPRGFQRRFQEVQSKTPPPEISTPFVFSLFTIDLYWFV